MRKLLIACSFGLVFAAPAQAADVDWKMYGTASIDGGVVCFYEGKGIIARAPSILRVWTKCLLQKDLDAVDMGSEVGKKIVESAARKMGNIYVPLIAVAEDIDFDQAIGVVTYEETANLSNI